MSSGLYEILGLDKQATPEQIRKAYRKKALITHPDRLAQGASAEEKQKANERFRLVNNAYEVLTNDERRELYDRYGVWPPSSVPDEPCPKAAPSYTDNPDGFAGDTSEHHSSEHGFSFTDPFELFESVSEFDSVYFGTSELPPLTEEDKLKFMQIFERSCPENGILTGLRSQEVLARSGLPDTTLAAIWELADVEDRGYLDAPAFTIAMYLVQACMSGKLAIVPPILPPHLYTEAAKEVPHSQDPPPAAATARSYAISPADRLKYDRFFDELDHAGTGYVEAEDAAVFFAQSGLVQEALAKIWDLADRNSDGRLTREEFAIAMHLTWASLAGKDVPDGVPDEPPPSTSLVPLLSNSRD